MALKLKLNSIIFILILFSISCQPKKEIVIAPDEILLNHSFNDLYDKPVDIKQYLGKPLLINYWATWCKFCLKDLPVVQQFADYHKGSHTVILLSDESVQKIEKFKAKQDYEMIFLRSNKPLSTYGVRQRPAFAYLLLLFL